MQMNPGMNPYGGSVVIPVHGATVSYEFNQAENQRIEKVGGRAKICGVISLLTGILGVLAGLAMIALLIVGAAEGKSAGAAIIVISAVLPPSIVNVIVGISYMNAGKALTAVTTTQGNDVQHMMASLERFKSAFRLETIMAGAAMVLGFTAGIVLRSMQ